MLNDFKNHIYDNNETMLASLNAEQTVFDNIEKTNLENFQNNFVLTAHLQGIENYERVLGIVPDLAIDTLEFRRALIINHLAMLAPYTKLFLQQKLNAIFGEGNWKLIVNNLIYTIYIDVETKIKGLYDKTMIDIRKIIPCNMILFTKLMITMKVDNNEYAQCIILRGYNKHITTPSLKEVRHGNI